MKVWQQFVVFKMRRPSNEMICHVISMAILAAFISYFFSETMGNLLRAWHVPGVYGRGPYDHGPLVALIWLSGVIFLIWKGTNTVSSVLTKRSAVLVLPAFALICFLSKVGEKFSVEMVQYTTMAAFLLLAVWFVHLPKERFKFFLLSLVLVSGVPIWDFSTRILLPIAIAITETMLAAFHIPVLISNTYVAIPYGTFEVAEGCSGLRYLLSGIAFSGTYAFLYIGKMKNALLFIAATCTLTVILNAVRITSVISAGYFSKMESPLVQDHNFLGWLLFSVALVLSLWIGQKIRGNEEQACV